MNELIERESEVKEFRMKHKRHQKDRRDKSEKAQKHEDHHYYKAEYCSKSDYRQYTMKDRSETDANEPKKLIIYIVNIRSDSIASTKF